MVDLIKRPRQKREQIAHDPGKGDRIAEGRQYPLLASYILCDVLLSIVMLVLIWKRMLPLKSTGQRILASLCNPIARTSRCPVDSVPWSI